MFQGLQARESQQGSLARVVTMRPGIPATNEFGGHARMREDPADSTLPAAIITPGPIIARAPIQQPFPI